MYSGTNLPSVASFSEIYVNFSQTTWWTFEMMVTLLIIQTS